MVPAPILYLARAILLFGSVFVAVILLGPFQGAERYLMLSDKQAHAAAFLIFTALSFVAAPRMRRSDLVLASLAIAAASEVAQALVGRDGNLSDLMADSLGIAIASGLDPVGRLWGERRRPTPRRRRGDHAPASARALEA